MKKIPREVTVLAMDNWEDMQPNVGEAHSVSEDFLDYASIWKDNGEWVLSTSGQSYENIEPGAVKMFEVDYEHAYGRKYIVTIEHVEGLVRKI